MGPVLDIVHDLSYFYLHNHHYHHPLFKRNYTRVEWLNLIHRQALPCPDDEVVPLTALSDVAPRPPVSWNREGGAGRQSLGCCVSQPAFEGTRGFD